MALLKPITSFGIYTQNSITTLDSYDWSIFKWKEVFFTFTQYYSPWNQSICPENWSIGRWFRFIHPWIQKGPPWPGGRLHWWIFFRTNGNNLWRKIRQAEELGLSLNEATYEILAHMALRCKKSSRRWRGGGVDPHRWNLITKERNESCLILMISRNDIYIYNIYISMNDITNGG